jgi:hypothetical protein
MNKSFSAILVLLISAIPAFAETITLKAELSAGAEIPPGNSSGQGGGDFSYDSDTNQLTYFIRYSGLMASVSSADIHGPAGPTSTGPAIIHFRSPDSPISGTKTLSKDQASALLNGQLYVELDTVAHGSGEIRGQIHR